MADIKQIEVSGAVYDIKDQTARNQIAAQGVTIANQQSQINGAVSTANQANQTASNLSGAVTANATAIAQLQGSARKFIMIGDSYGDGYSPDGSTTGWCDRVATYLGLTSGVNYWTNHAGGACFGRNDSLGFSALLDGVSVPAAERSSITDIIIGGGYNDNAWSVANVNAGMDRVENIVISKYPNARVWIFAMGWSYDSRVRLTLGQIYDEAYSRTAHSKGWLYREVFEQLQYVHYLSSDGIHPNANGLYLIANCVAGFLQNSNMSETTQRFPVTVNGVEYGYAWRTDKYVYLMLNPFNISGEFTITAHGYRKVASIGNPYIMGAANTIQFAFVVPVILQTASDGFYSCVASATLVRESDGTVGLYLMSNGVKRDGSEYMPINITGLQFGAFSATIPIQVA